jgi:hypothetical protein
MSRPISVPNLAEINASHLHEVMLVEMLFDTPVYAHSGVGSIVFNSNTYLGVGDFGGISNATETENLRPTSLTLQLSGIDANLITEALDSGNYGDIVTIYVGYRQDGGTLVDDPWIIWRGKYEYSQISQGDTNVISIIVQHDLAILDEIEGSRFTDEDQQSKFPGDLGLRYVTDTASVKLFWAGGSIGGGGGGNGPARIGPRK